jgi:transcriptional antiterminator RfaH
MNWIVVRTKLNMEFKASFNINEQGFKTFLPKYKTFVRHARKISRTTKPLFSRYIFVKVHCENSWQIINNTRGVNNILMNNNLPSFIDDKVFYSFLEQFDKDGFLKNKEKYKNGDIVQIDNKRFYKYKTIFKEYISKKRAKLFLKILNNQLIFTTDVSKLSHVL